MMDPKKRLKSSKKEDREEFETSVQLLLDMAMEQFERKGSINANWFSQEISNELKGLDTDWGYIPKKKEEVENKDIIFKIKTKQGI